MKKIVKITDIDCANCAAELERAISKIDGVNEVSINFMTEKMIIDIIDDKYEEVVKQINKVKNKLEPDSNLYLYVP